MRDSGWWEPRILANGYRDYSAEDMERLKKVAVLRKLGLPAAEIRMVLEDGGPKGLSRALDRKALELDVLKEKQELFQALTDSMDWEEARPAAGGAGEEADHPRAAPGRLSGVLRQISQPALLPLSQGANCHPGAAGGF